MIGDAMTREVVQRLALALADRYRLDGVGPHHVAVGMVNRGPTPQITSSGRDGDRMVRT
jgi:hypothetical protein